MKKNIFHASLAVPVSALIAVSGVANGQIVGRATQQDWANAGGDVQRTNWQRITPGSPASRTINPETVAGAKIDFSSPDEMSGFGLQLKTKLENTSRNGASLSGGATITAAGLGLNMGMVGASGNRTIGLDMDTGYEYYVKKYGGENPTGSLLCPGSSLATPARSAVLSISRPTEIVPTPDGTGKIGYWTQSYAPGVGISNQRTPSTGPGPITASPTTAAASGRPGGFVGRPAVAPTALLKPINAPGAALGTGQDANGGALPQAPTGRLPVLYGVVGAEERTNPIGPGAGVSNNTYTVSNDGKVHFLTQQYGLDAVEPLPFLPAGAQATDLIHLNSVLYTSTVNGCGGAPNGVWGVTTIMIPRGPGSEVDPRLPSSFRSFGAPPPPADPKDALPPLPARGQVFKWETGGTASPSPVTFLPSGVAVIATSSGTGMGDSIITLNTPAMTPVTQTATLALSVKAKFTQAGADFVTAPIVLPTTPFTPGPASAAAPNTNLIAAQARDGRIFILNEELTAPLHVTAPVAGIGGYKPAGLSSWVDNTGQRWLLSTTPTSVIARKLTVDGNTASLSQGWSLTGLQAPLAPIIVNGVVFIASSGEYVPPAGANLTEAQRIANSKPAVLYAVNAVTGAKLWDSGKTITSFAPHTSALWTSLGQVLLSTYDNTFYAFGANMERHSNKSIQMAH